MLFVVMRIRNLMVISILLRMTSIIRFNILLRILNIMYPLEPWKIQGFGAKNPLAG